MTSTDKIRDALKARGAIVRTNTGGQQQQQPDVVSADGWILCDDQMPPKGVMVEAQERSGQIHRLQWFPPAAWAFEDRFLYMGWPILRWRPLDE